MLLKTETSCCFSQVEPDNKQRKTGGKAAQRAKKVHRKGKDP